MSYTGAGELRIDDKLTDTSLEVVVGTRPAREFALGLYGSDALPHGGGLVKVALQRQHAGHVQLRLRRQTT